MSNNDSGVSSIEHLAARIKAIEDRVLHVEVALAALTTDRLTAEHAEPRIGTVGDITWFVVHAPCRNGNNEFAATSVGSVKKGARLEYVGKDKGYHIARLLSACSQPLGAILPTGALLRLDESQYQHCFLGKRIR